MVDKFYDANDLAVLIRDNSDLTGDDIREEVRSIQDEFDGLVGQEAACFLLARRVDVDLRKRLDLQKELDLDVENLVEDMNSVSIEFTVEKVLSVNEFDGGCVRNIKVSDDTGSTHLVVWGDDTEVFDDVDTGVVLRVENGYSKFSDYNSQVEVHIGDGGRVVEKKSGRVLIDR